MGFILTIIVGNTNTAFSIITVIIKIVKVMMVICNGGGGDGNDNGDSTNNLRIMMKIITRMMKSNNQNYIFV